jgi:hypothetical protein
MKKRKPMRWPILFVAIASIEGCFYGGPTVESIAAPQVKIPAPAPLAKDIDLRIVNGDLVRCDAGCENLLRGYAATREAILTAWPPK